MTSWNKQWNLLLKASRLPGENECYYVNEDRARQYDASAAIWEDAARRVSDLDPDPSWTVLEIGPGPGVMTIPLAKRVKSVTVVEPSPAMVSILRGHLAEEGISNVSIIPKKWEDTSSSVLSTYTLVLASYSLNMVNMADCLEKMCIHATDAVHLWWFDGITSWEKIRFILVPVILGKNISPNPKSDLLMQMLREMGYDPRHEVLTGTSFPNRFDRYEDACLRVASLLGLEPGAELPLPVSRFIEETWKQEDGTYGYEDSTIYVHITVPVIRER